MKQVAALLLLLSLPVIAQAKEETRSYNKPPAQVYEAALTVAKENGVVIYSDKEHLSLTFKSGGYWDKGFEVSVRIQGENADKSSVTVKTQKTYFGTGLGAAKRITRNFFAALDDKLGK
jgi:hypothetical protein